MASVVARRTLAARLPDLSRATLRNTQTKGGVRQMSGGSYEEEMGNTNMWRNVTFVGLPCVLGLTAWIFSKDHGHGHDQPAYSYLQIRNKDFPWGKDNLFDVLSGKAKHE